MYTDVHIVNITQTERGAITSKLANTFFLHSHLRQK